jgi:RNA polymerase primary sigma factor
MKTKSFPRDRAASDLQLYLQDINTTALLSADEERELAARVAEGDLLARDHMVRANLRLVVNLARGYLGKGLSLEDLIAEGNLGLLRAVEGFNGNMAIRFSTYASYWIKQSMRRAVINQGKAMRLPAYMVNRVTKWRRAIAVLTDRLGRTPTTEELARALKLSQRKADMIVQAIRVQNLMNQLDGGEDEGTADWIVDDRTQSAVEALAEADEHSRLLQALTRLDRRAADVIRMRFGLGDNRPMTLQEIGEALGLTRERIRQLEKQAMKQLAENC